MKPLGATELADTAAQLHALLRLSPGAIVQLDPTGALLTANDQWLALSGLTLEQSKGSGWAAAIHPDDLDRVGDDWAAHAASGTAYQTTLRFRTPSGRVHWVRVNTAPTYRDDVVVGHLASVTDVTALRLAEQKVAAMQARFTDQAFHDSLTNLPNRAGLLARLDLALLEAAHTNRGVGVLFLDLDLDLDRFKSVNDPLGHQARDAILVEITARIQLDARADDTVARIGGDEFVLVCPDLHNEQELIAVADQLQVALARPIALGSVVASIDAIIGTVWGTGGEGSEALLATADGDALMYRAKNRVEKTLHVVEDPISPVRSQRLEFERDLREAAGRGEIENWYQPIVDLQSPGGADIVATEALARWRRPGRGIVMPGNFIGIAEEAGLITEIGTAVLNQACVAGTGFEHLRVSVNVSAQQFARNDFGAIVRQALRVSGLPASRLCLELTESALVEAIDSAAATFQDLRELGVRLAIDDFGTGYSSFAHLRSFTFDVLKIDMTFIRGIEESRRDRGVVEGILRLADVLRLDVVAEGIETAGQRDLLTQMGCRFGQGYFFSRPAPTVEPTIVSQR